MTQKQKKDFRAEFDRILDECGDSPIGIVKTDYILQMMAAQGFWSGVAYRLYYDEKTGFLLQEKHYGDGR